MGEQEKYKRLLKKMIEQTENSTIQTSEELVKALVSELKQQDVIGINK